MTFERPHAPTRGVLHQGAGIGAGAQQLADLIGNLLSESQGRRRP